MDVDLPLLLRSATYDNVSVNDNVCTPPHPSTPHPTWCWMV